jgi:hypothetical protein
MQILQGTVGSSVTCKLSSQSPLEMLSGSSLQYKHLSALVSGEKKGWDTISSPKVQEHLFFVKSCFCFLI